LDRNPPLPLRAIILAGLRPARRAATAVAAALLVSPAVAVPIATLVVDVPTVTTYAPATGTDAPDLLCPTTAHKTVTPREAPPDASEPQDIPDSGEVETALGDLGPESLAPSPARSGAPDVRLGQAKPGQPYRVGVFGDSHFAAAFFTDELVRLLRVSPALVRPGFLSAGLGRPGIRLPVRKSCFSSGWRYEPAYASTAAAAAPGPGLVNLVATGPGPWLAIDLRDSSRAADLRSVDVLYLQTSAAITVGVSVDGGAEQAVVLAGAEGPGQLQLRTSAPLSTVRLRVIAGSLTFHGLRLDPPGSPAAEIDLFGFPGATVTGLQRANLPYLGNWFFANPYDLVMLEFGTNEGNVPAFDPAHYRQAVTEAVENLQKVFPTAACVLVGPGDRGVLVSSHGAHRRHAGAARRPGDLFRYSKIHATISSIQEAVATSHGCAFWSMQRSMGGIGAAYAWARQKPALMSRDLTHFTPAGYRELADRFARDMAWAPEWLLADGAPFTPHRAGEPDPDARRERRRNDRP
jgi:hypothetical protein